MNTDIRVSVSFRGHRKRKKLQRMLGAEAVLCLLDLWIVAAMSKPDGVFDGMDNEDIAMEAGWEGDPDQFVHALVSVGFLDDLGSGIYALHDWDEHNSYVVSADVRSDKARMSKLRQSYPVVWNYLQSTGQKSISKSEYSYLIGCYLKGEMPAVAPRKIGDSVATANVQRSCGGATATQDDGISDAKGSNQRCNSDATATQKKEISDATANQETHGVSLAPSPYPYPEPEPYPEPSLKKEKEKDSLSGKDRRFPPYDVIIDLLNTAAGTSFSAYAKESQRCIKARWATGFVLEDFRDVIDHLVAKWGKDAKMVEYIRPLTLFGAKFESYLQDARRVVVADGAGSIGSPVFRKALEEAHKSNEGRHATAA